MITGFVLYRSGFFDNDNSQYAFQKSPNGGELNNVNTEQDSTKTDTIKKLQIMPSSKLLVPAIDLEGEIMPSSKSMSPVFNIEELAPSSKSLLHPINIDLDSLFIPEHLRRRSEYNYASSSKSTILSNDWLKMLSEVPKTALHAKTIETTLDTVIVEKDLTAPTEVSKEYLEKYEKPKVKEEKPGGIAWGMIGLGVLGILFVGIGSIVYFKRRSK